MKRLLLLTLPVLAFAASGEGERKSKEETLGAIWQDSVTKEGSGEPEAALRLTATYLKEGGDPYMVAMRAAWLQYNSKNYDEAAKQYANAARIQPGALSPRFGLLNIARDKSDVPGSLKAGELVLAVEPTNCRALYAVAWGSFQAKSYPRAASAYRKILSLYPEEQDALSGAAWAAFYQGQKAEAKQLFRRLLSVNPEYSNARQGLAACK